MVNGLVGRHLSSSMYFPFNTSMRYWPYWFFFHQFVGPEDIVTGNPAVEVGDFFQAVDLAVLVLFDGLDKDGRVDKALMGSGIKPGKALAEEFHIETAFLQVDAVKICDLVLSAGGGLQIPGNADDAVVIEVQAGDAVIALGMRGLLFYADGLAMLVEFHKSGACHHKFHPLYMKCL